MFRLSNTISLTTLPVDCKSSSLPSTLQGGAPSIAITAILIPKQPAIPQYPPQKNFHNIFLASVLRSHRRTPAQPPHAPCPGKLPKAKTHTPTITPESSFTLPTNNATIPNEHNNTPYTQTPSRHHATHPYLRPRQAQSPRATPLRLAQIIPPPNLLRTTLTRRHYSSNRK